MSNLKMEALGEYELMDDEDVVEFARSGNSLALDYLLKKYKKIVKAKSAFYFIAGGDKDDIIQEGMIGLFKAIKSFDRNKFGSFVHFVNICIKGQMISAVKSANRNKHIPLNSYISLNKPYYDDNTDRTLIEVLEGSRTTDPMELFISIEEVDKMEREMSRLLSDLEFEVAINYLDGKSYDEISKAMDKDFKCIDNALQRARKKLASK